MRLAVAMIGAMTLAACQLIPATGGGSGQQARAALEAKSGSTVGGQVNFREASDHVLVTAKITGLKPNSEHGFHVHEKGDCSAPDAMSAAGHFNPDSQPHGHHGHDARHAGDMANLVADAKGEAVVTYKVNTIRVSDGKHGILNRAVVVHANPDDYKSQPAGNAGARIACGVIRKV